MPPPNSKFNFALIYYLIFGLSFTARAQEDQIKCGLDIPTEIYQKLLEKVPEIEAFAAAQQNNALPLQNNEIIPVRFTNIQGPGGSGHLSQAQVDFTLNKLNTGFAPLGFTFVQCGEINEIWDDRIKISEDIDNFTSSFAYASGTVEVYYKYSGNLESTPLAPIPEQSYAEGNPNYNSIGLYHHNNFILTHSSADLGNTAIHEMGHHFGLLHTFHVGALYNAPPASDANDHPYPVMINGNFSPTWWGRELVIRTDVLPPNSKPFPTINFNRSGDLIADTPADCQPDKPDKYPGCPLVAQNTIGCNFNNSVTYVDYNGDAIYPPPAGLSLGRNYMSYWNESCLNQFTPKQLERINFYYQNVRKPKYTPDRCGTFTDNVQFQGGNTGLHNVSIRVRHATNQKCNVTTDLQGDFSGLLHQDNLQTWIYHNGKKDVLEFANDPLKIHYGHNRCDWIRGVTSGDLGKIGKHILGTDPLNGYGMIAADADKSGTVTTFDIVEIRRLILGIYMESMPNQEQPFVYIPEHVPQNNAQAFNTNPFTLLGGAYLNQGWAYTAPPIGQRGFDGIKIGDVDSTWLSNLPPCQDPEGEIPALNVPPTPLNQNQIVMLNFKTSNPLQLSAFQFGLHIPSDKFEVQGIITNSLPNFSSSDHFGTNHLEEDGILTTLWFDETGGALTLSAGSTLFSVVVKATQNIANLQTELAFNNDITPNMIFQTPTLVSTPVALTVEVSPSMNNRGETVWQNPDASLRCEPNPTQHNFNVYFTNEGRATAARLKLTDMTGRVMFEQEWTLIEGDNSIEVNALQNAPAGTYMLMLEADDKTTVTRLIKQ